MPFGFGEHWVKAEAVVVAKQDGGSSASKYVVEVRPANERPFRVEMHDPFWSTAFWYPVAGSDVGVEYNPKNHDVRWDKDDPRVNMLAKKPQAAKDQEKQAYEAALRAAPGSGISTPSFSPSVAGLDPELAELERMVEAEALASAAQGSQQVSATPPGGFNFQFTADGAPAVGQVDAVVSGVASGQIRQIRGSAAELLATGTPGSAVITAVSPLGKKVRDVNPNADPARLDDPMWLFTLLVTVPGMAPFPSVFGHRVPKDKLADVAPGAGLIVAVDPADHSRVAIDWDRSPVHAGPPPMSGGLAL